MQGCDSCAAVSASRKKRDRISERNASSGGRSLIATCRLRRRSLAQYTIPMPPRPISRSTSYVESSTRSTWERSSASDCVICGSSTGPSMGVDETESIAPRRTRIQGRDAFPEGPDVSIPDLQSDRPYVMTAYESCNLRLYVVTQAGTSLAGYRGS